MRTHKCGELRKEHIGQRVILYGWARSIRHHKDMEFVNLTDRYGWVQVCADKIQCQNIGREYFLKVIGEVIARPATDINTNIPTGEVEIKCEQMEVVSPCEVLPFDIQDVIDVREEVRLKYRFLDIRRPAMLERLTTRSRIASAIRKSFESQGFLEIETPLMVRSTPEGSRDFVVPSRTIPGKFYALPQSPQLYKQLLMVAGIDRYYQFPKCFRDEDPRRERQLVHTQIDIEMALVQQEDIFDCVEQIMAAACEEALGIKLSRPFPHYEYDEVMRRWGIDKPDLRFGMELVDFTNAIADSGVKIFEEPLAKKGLAKGLVAPGCADYSRTKIKELEDYVANFQLQGLAAFKVKGGSLEGSWAKKMNIASLRKILEYSQAKENDLILIGAGPASSTNRGLAELRKLLGKRLNLIPQGQYQFLWVTDFPLFEWNEEGKKWDAMHHIFSMPNPKYLNTLEQNPGDVKGILYDLVLNGVELGSGSLRITSPDLQKRVMKIIGMEEEKAERMFGFLLNAYRYGAPTHGGMGLGLDNFVMTILGLENIREVIAFPNASNGMFLYDNAPSPLEPEQIKELHIKLDVPPDTKDA